MAQQEIPEEAKEDERNRDHQGLRIACREGVERIGRNGGSRRDDDQLPSAEFATARRILELLARANSDDWPSLRNAPVDDEPETEQERAAVERAYRSPRELDTDHEDFRRELGL